MRHFGNLIIRRAFVSKAATAPRPSTTPVIPTMRDYQRECVQICLDSLAQGARKQVVSLPVGSGKTVVMANLIEQVPNPTRLATKTLILAHRTELLEQASNQIMRFHPSWNVVIEQGKRKPDIDQANVVVASVQTLGRDGSCRLERYDPAQFKTIVIDEAHHAAAKTYLRILDHFGASDPDSHIFVWGCSATVRRHDGLALDGVFDDVSYHMDLLQMIESGWLCPLKVTTVQTSIDLNNVSIRNDDFVQSELARVVNTEHRNKIIFESWKKYASDTRSSTLVFAVDINHTLALCNVFREHGIDAEYITSKTSTTQRADILARYRNGDFPVLVNCGILTEGTDIPRIDCILMARPTRSSVLFQQMFGRGMRLYPGKEDCTVIDFVDNFERAGRAGLVTFPSLMGLDPRQVVQDESLLIMEQRAEEQEQEQVKVQEDPNPGIDMDAIRLKITEYDDLNEFITEASLSPELRDISVNSWVTVGEDTCALHILDLGTVILKRDPKDGIWRGKMQRTRKIQRESEEQKKAVHCRARSIPLACDTRTSAIQAADTWLNHEYRKHKHLLHRAKRNAAYRFKPATKAQLEYLSKRFNVQPKKKLTKGQAMDLLLRLSNGQGKIWRHTLAQAMEQERATQKQKESAVLRRRNIAV